jgi:hypothetical protein
LIYGIQQFFFFLASGLLDGIGFGLQLEDKISVFERTEVDTDIQQGSQYSGTGGHHCYTGICDGIPVAEAGNIGYNGHHIQCFAGYFQRNEGGLFGCLLDSGTSGGFLFVGCFW